MTAIANSPMPQSPGKPSEGATESVPSLVMGTSLGFF